MKNKNYSNLSLWILSFGLGFGIGAIISIPISIFLKVNKENPDKTLISFFISYVLGIILARIILYFFTKSKIYKRMQNDDTLHAEIFECKRCGKNYSEEINEETGNKIFVEQKTFPK